MIQETLQKTAKKSQVVQYRNKIISQTAIIEVITQRIFSLNICFKN